MLLGDMGVDIRMNKPYISTSMVALIILLKCKSGGGNKKLAKNLISQLYAPLPEPVYLPMLSLSLWLVNSK